MLITATIQITMDVSEGRAERIQACDKTAFLQTLYKPSKTNGKWWVQGDVLINQNNENAPYHGILQILSKGT